MTRQKSARIQLSVIAGALAVALAIFEWDAFVFVATCVFIALAVVYIIELIERAA